MQSINIYQEKNTDSSDDDRVQFLDLLQEFSDRFNIEVHAYVLMGNRYHLLMSAKG